MVKKDHKITECVSASGAKVDIDSGVDGWDTTRPCFVEGWSKSPHTGLSWSELASICKVPELLKRYQIEVEIAKTKDKDGNTIQEAKIEPVLFNKKPVIDAEAIWSDIKNAYFEKYSIAIEKIKYSRGQSGAKLTKALNTLTRVEALVAEMEASGQSPEMIAMMKSILSNK